MGQLNYNTSTSGSVTITKATEFTLTALRSVDSSYNYSGDYDITYSNEGSCTKEENLSTWPPKVTVTPTGTFYQKTRILTITWTIDPGTSRSVSLDVYADKNGNAYGITIDTTATTFVACESMTIDYSMTSDGVALATKDNLAVNAYLYDSNGSQVASGVSSAGKDSVKIDLGAVFIEGSYTLRIELQSDSSVFVTKSVTIEKDWTLEGIDDVEIPSGGGDSGGGDSGGLSKVCGVWIANNENGPAQSVTKVSASGSSSYTLDKSSNQSITINTNTDEITTIRIDFLSNWCKGSSCNVAIGVCAYWTILHDDYGDGTYSMGDDHEKRIGVSESTMSVASHTLIYGSDAGGRLTINITFS